MTSESSSSELRRVFKEEKAVEQGRRRAGRTAVVVAPAAIVPSGPHTPVSNEAVRERIAGLSAPAFGTKGKPKGKSIEAKLPAKVQTEAAPAAGPGEETMWLDAYWASFGDAGTRALLRNRKAQEAESILEVVIGKDDRVEVGNTHDYPWRCIASLLISAADGTGWIGTGWLVGPRILLTAGHCVYMADHGGWVESIEVIPGRRGGERPFKSCVATQFRSSQGWVQEGSREHDYAAILLPEDCRYGDELGWFGYAVWSDETLKNLEINISGYPGDKPNGTQWWHCNTITDVAATVLTYQIDTAGGQSGAPVWVYKADGGRYGVGIHTNGAVTGNSATRMIREVFDNIGNWKAEVP